MEFGRIWQAADKIVYSKSLETVSTPKTRLMREFEPRFECIIVCTHSSDDTKRYLRALASHA